jgi:hypothetical protein
MKQIVLSLFLMLSMLSVNAQSDTLMTPEEEMTFLLNSFQVGYGMNDTAAAVLLTQIVNEYLPYCVDYDVSDMHKIKNQELYLFRDVTYYVIERLKEIVYGTNHP